MVDRNHTLSDFSRYLSFPVSKLALLIITGLIISSFLANGGLRATASPSGQEYISVKYWPAEASPLTEEDKQRIKRLYQQHVLASQQYPRAKTYKIDIRFYRSSSLGADQAEENVRDLFREFMKERTQGIALAIDLDTRTANYFGARDKVSNQFMRQSLASFFRQEEPLTIRIVDLAEKIAGKLTSAHSTSSSADSSSSNAKECNKEIPDSEQEMLGCGSGKHKGDRKIRMIDYYLDKTDCQIKQKTQIEYVHDPACLYGGEEVNNENKRIKLLRVKHDIRDEINLPRMRQKLKERLNSGQELPARSKYQYLHQSFLIETTASYMRVGELIDYSLVGGQLLQDINIRTSMEIKEKDEVLVDVYIKYLKAKGGQVEQMLGCGDYALQLKFKNLDGSYRIVKSDEFKIIAKNYQGDCIELQDSPQAKIDLMFYGVDYSDLDKFVKDVKTGLNGDQGLFTLQPFKDNRELFKIQYFTYTGEKPNCRQPRKQEEYNYQTCREPPSLRAQCPLEHGNRVIIYYINQSFVSDASFIRNSRGSQSSRISTRRGLVYDKQFPAVLAHEMGHAIGHLRDEYIKEGVGDHPGKPNCAPTQTKAEQWWGDLQGKGRGEVEVDYYAGCSYVENNVRPHRCSLMRTTDCSRYGFGPVNIRHICQVAELTQGICHNYR